LQTAWENNPKVAVAKAHREEALSDVAIARAPWWPKINLAGMNSFGLGGSSQASGITGLVNSPFRRGFGGGVDASWVVYDFGQTSQRVRVADQEAKAREAESAQQMLAIHIGVVQSYLECAFYEQWEVLLGQREKRQELLVEEIKTYVQSGLTSPVELDLSKAALEKTHAERTQAGGMRRQATERLAQWMGQDTMQPFECVIPPGPMADAQPMVTLQENALKNRPEVKAARMHWEVTRAATHAAGGERLPKIVAVSSVGLLANTSPSGGRSWSANGRSAWGNPRKGCARCRGIRGRWFRHRLPTTRRSPERPPGTSSGERSIPWGPSGSILGCTFESR
jgi:adhesin transport system outer membrane protein